MKHVEIKCGRRTFERDMPTSWNEMTCELMPVAAKLWMGSVTKEKFLALFLDVPDKVVDAMGPYLRFCLLQLTEWIEKLEPMDRFVMDQLADTQLLLPPARLGACSLEQFMMADTHFQRFAIDASAVDSLDVFIAALCHSSETLDMEQKVEIVSGLDPVLKTSVFINFIMIRKWLSRSYPFLFPPPAEEEEEIKADAKKHKPRPTDWLAIFDAFMGDDVAFIDRYKQMAALDAFRLMNRRIKASKERS